MITVKELAQEITRELSELYLRIEGDDYRQLYVERNVNLEAISELEKQLGEANARIAELEADNAELKERVAMLDVTAVYKSLGEMGCIEQVANLKAENAALQARIAELELENLELRKTLGWAYDLDEYKDEPEVQE